MYRTEFWTLWEKVRVGCFERSAFFMVQLSHPYMTTGKIMCVCLVTQSCQTVCDPMDCTLPGSSVHGDTSGRNTGVGYHVLLQGVFPTQESNPGLPHCRLILYRLNHQGSPSFGYVHFVGKVRSLLFNMLFRFVIPFLLRSKHLLISWLQSPSIVILEPKQIKSVTLEFYGVI